MMTTVPNNLSDREVMQGIGIQWLMNTKDAARTPKGENNLEIRLHGVTTPIW